MENAPELRRGGSGDTQWVTYLRQMLNHHYQHNVVAEDGDFDEALEGVVRHLQEQNGRTADGIVDAEVWSLLNGQNGGQGEHSGSGQQSDQHSDQHSGQQTQINLRDYPEMSEVAQRGEQYMDQFFDDSSGADDGPDARLIAASRVEAHDECGEKQRTMTLAWAGFLNALNNLMNDQTAANVGAVVVTFYAFLHAYQGWKDCVSRNTLAPEGPLAELDRSVEQLEAEAERMQVVAHQP